MEFMSIYLLGMALVAIGAYMAYRRTDIVDFDLFEYSFTVLIMLVPYLNIVVGLLMIIVVSIDHLLDAMDI